jgi:hypothetical protein
MNKRLPGFQAPRQQRDAWLVFCLLHLHRLQPPSLSRWSRASPAWLPLLTELFATNNHKNGISRQPLRHRVANLEMQITVSGASANATGRGAGVPLSRTRNQAGWPTVTLATKPGVDRMNGTMDHKLGEIELGSAHSEDQVKNSGGVVAAGNIAVLKMVLYPGRARPGLPAPPLPLPRTASPSTTRRRLALLGLHRSCAFSAC